MAAKLIQEYGEKNPASAIDQRTPEDIAQEYEKKVDMGLEMYKNGITFLCTQYITHPCGDGEAR